MGSGGYVPALKLRALAKHEYEALKGLCEKYGFNVNYTGEKVPPSTAYSEMFSVLLRLGEEVLRYHPPQGEKWFIRIVQEYRQDKASGE